MKLILSGNNRTSETVGVSGSTWERGRISADKQVLACGFHARITIVRDRNRKHAMIRLVCVYDFL